MEAHSALNGQQFRDENLVLTLTNPREAAEAGPRTKWYRIFVGGLPTNVDDDKLKLLFEPFGEILLAKVVNDTQSKSSRGFGFVTFAQLESAKAAIESMNNVVLEDRKLEINWAVLRRRNQQEEDLRRHPKYNDVYCNTFPNNTSVYVGNLPPDVPKDAVYKLLLAAFKKFGSVSKVVVAECVKYAFIVYQSKHDATCAILAMHGKALCGAGTPEEGSYKSLKCNWANVQHDYTRNSSRQSSGADYGLYDPTAMASGGPTDYASNGFYTANGRTRSSAGIGYRTNQQNLMSWFWNVPQQQQQGNYGYNSRNQYTTNPQTVAPPYSSYFGYNYGNMYRGNALYYNPDQTSGSSNVPDGSLTSNSLSQQQQGRYTSQQGYSSSTNTRGGSSGHSGQSYSPRYSSSRSHSNN